MTIAVARTEIKYIKLHFIYIYSCLGGRSVREFIEWLNEAVKTPNKSTEH